MNVTLEKSVINGSVKAIPSKSYAHRVLICNFLAKKPLADEFGFTSNDIESTKRCLSCLKNGESALDCGESGSTLRFIIPLVSALGGKYKLIGQGRLMQRPNEQLLSVLNLHGVTATQGECVNIDGKLTAGEYKIKGDISSQYVSGLLMALPLLDGDSTVVLTTKLESAPYVDITIQVLKEYGVIIKPTDYGFFIKGNQKYLGNSTVEGDWSNSAFFMVLGAISGKVTVDGLNLDSVQGDRAILDVLKKAGTNVQVLGSSITVQKSPLKAFTMDAKDCPDLVPIASVLGAYAKGVTVIKNVQRLRIKESDRIESTIKMLEAFGVKAHSDGQDLTVFGSSVKAGKTPSFNDHRIVMSATVLASGASGKSIIIDAKAVEKSYPTFFKDYQSVGGNVSEI